MNSAIAPQKLGLLLFFFIFLFLFQERRSSQPFLFLFFFGAEGRVRIGGPAGISLPLGECSVAIGLLLIICVFTRISNKLFRRGGWFGCPLFRHSDLSHAIMLCVSGGGEDGRAHRGVSGTRRGHLAWICGVTDGVLFQDRAGWADISLVLLVNDPLVLLQLFVAYRIKRILSVR